MSGINMLLKALYNINNFVDKVNNRTNDQFNLFYNSVQ